MGLSSLMQLARTVCGRRCHTTIIIKVLAPTTVHATNNRCHIAAHLTQKKPSGGHVCGGWVAGSGHGVEQQADHLRQIRKLFFLIDQLMEQKYIKMLMTIMTWWVSFPLAE